MPAAKIAHENEPGTIYPYPRAPFIHDTKENDMKKYLAVYTGTPAAFAAWEALSDRERQRRQKNGMAAWQKWAADNAASIVEFGGPLSKTTLVNKSGVREISNNLSAFTVVQAKSRRAAASLFVDHPHFAIFPGEGVEIMEIMPTPG